MVEVVNKLDGFLKVIKEYVSKTPEVELSKKNSPEKWSKKQIIGHLIDSGINNLQRFTEIQFEAKPYRIRQYNQVELVNANDYQNADIMEIVDFLSSINIHIKGIINLQTPQTLKYEIEFENGDVADLRFLITDYVKHFEHHMKQIIKE